MHAGQSAGEQQRGSSSSGDRDPEGRHVKVGYVLRRYGFERHYNTVSRICLVRGSGRRGEASTVLTASRDGTLKVWDFPANESQGGSMSSSAPAPPAVPKLRCSLEEHAAWVNDAVVLPAFATSADGARDNFRVLSASNDNLVKVWSVDVEKPGVGVVGALLSLRYHVDYVTALSYSAHKGLLASAGLDNRTVVADVEAATRILNLSDSDGVDAHSGAAARRGQSAHWNSSSSPVHRCSVGMFSGSGQYIPQLLATPAKADPGYENGRSGWGEDAGGGGGGSGAMGASIWSLAMSRNASLLACGTASCAVRGWDPRSGSKLWRLRGHTGNVRALLLSDDGAICISGSADRTVRVWDVGMRRCIHVFEDHTDSIWALAMAGDSCGYSGRSVPDAPGGHGLQTIFSGGRDGVVMTYNLRLMQATAVAREATAIQALAVPADAQEVWCAASDSHVRRHAVPAPYQGSGGRQGQDAGGPPGAFLPSSPPPPAPTEDSIVIPGVPRLTDYRVLYNKRQILVRDANNDFALWDVTSGRCADLPALSQIANSVAPPGAPRDQTHNEEVMKRAFGEVNKLVSVPTWFSCDIALGSLSVSLTVNQCFKAEAEESDFVVPPGTSGNVSKLSAAANGTPGPGETVNLGVKALRGLFESWVRSPATGGSVAPAPMQSQLRHSQSSGPRPRIFALPLITNGAGGATSWDHDEQPPGTPSGLVNGLAEALAFSRLSRTAFPPATAITLVGRSGRFAGFRGRLFCGFFSGNEVPDLLPPWVVDVVWNQRPPPEEFSGERSVQFTLMRGASDNASLPNLASPYCVAAPQTRIQQVIGYLVSALDVDWASPVSKAASRGRPLSTGLVSRLGRCCAAPASSSRGRSSSGDSWSSGQDGADDKGGQRSRSSSRGNDRRSSGRGGSSRARRPFSFGGRSGQDDSRFGGSGNVMTRVRIDSLRGAGTPSAPSLPAVAAAAGRGGNVATVGPAGEERLVEVYCHDKLLDAEMTLATVRDFLWKKGSQEMVLHYFRAAPRMPAPTPAMMTPPSSAATPSSVTPSIVANAASPLPVTVGVPSMVLGSKELSAAYLPSEGATAPVVLTSAGGLAEDADALGAAPADASAEMPPIGEEVSSEIRLSADTVRPPSEPAGPQCIGVIDSAGATSPAQHD
eukprot:TRINITY_DN111185_c0_g1_i1.p1 TRINITY_DN111185_c0_g1~~TRINITY_DN111185_c0_g1_i1.p1  ORF type:complete len:1151 (-),score=204.39 TRINITY_DN111185_c0_g1_i1:109-3561(-)